MHSVLPSVESAPHLREVLIYIASLKCSIRKCTYRIAKYIYA